MTHKLCIPLALLCLSSALAGGGGPPLSRNNAATTDLVLAGNSNPMLLNAAGHPVLWQNGPGLARDNAAAPAAYVLITVNGQRTRYTLSTPMSTLPTSLGHLRVIRGSASVLETQPAFLPSVTTTPQPTTTYTLVDAEL